MTMPVEGGFALKRAELITRLKEQIKGNGYGAAKAFYLRNFKSEIDFQTFRNILYGNSRNLPSASVCDIIEKGLL